MKKHLGRKAGAALFAAAFLAQLGTALPAQTAFAEDTQYLYGDLDGNGILSTADLSLMKAGLIGAAELDEIRQRAFDVDGDGTGGLSDVVMLQKYLLTEIAEFPAGVWFTVNTEEPQEPEEPDEPTEESAFLSASIKEHGASLSTAGSANLVVFYVDFPDCRYSYAPSEEELNQIAFGAADTSNPCYPFESFTAFYDRASKGNMQLSGRVFRYTTKENQAVYDDNKVKIAEECYDAFKDTVDFAQFDGDGDGRIDTTLFTTPTNAGDDHWWPCAGAFGDPQYVVDGKTVGHIITGNAQVESTTDYVNFISSYCHEMGHCTGLPDYYLYTSNDSEGMHGAAGIELMDTDAGTDFGAFSKLMLGFYRENQVEVYDTSMGTKTYTLRNAQTDAGNCVIIPYQNQLGDHYFSEFFIMEYASQDGNNSRVPWWQKTGSGVRIYHIDATTEYGWNTYFRYASGSEFSDSDRGRRLIRIIDDTDTDNFYHAGDVITNSIQGFNWYDANAQQTVDPGLKITVDSFADDSYTVTISAK